MSKKTPTISQRQQPTLDFFFKRVGSSGSSASVQQQAVLPSRLSQPIVDVDGDLGANELKDFTGNNNSRAVQTVATAAAASSPNTADGESSNDSRMSFGVLAPSSQRSQQPWDARYEGSSSSSSSSTVPRDGLFHAGARETVTCPEDGMSTFVGGRKGEDTVGRASMSDRTNVKRVLTASGKRYPRSDDGGDDGVVLVVESEEEGHVRSVRKGFGGLRAEGDRITSNTPAESREKYNSDNTESSAICVDDSGADFEVIPATQQHQQQHQSVYAHIYKNSFEDVEIHCRYEEDKEGTTTTTAAVANTTICNGNGLLLGSTCTIGGESTATFLASPSSNSSFLIATAAAVATEGSKPHFSARTDGAEVDDEEEDICGTQQQVISSQSPPSLSTTSAVPPPPQEQHQKATVLSTRPQVSFLLPESATIPRKVSSFHIAPTPPPPSSKSGSGGSQQQQERPSVPSNACTQQSPEQQVPHRFLSANYDSSSTASASASSAVGAVMRTNGSSSVVLKKTVLLPWDSRHRYRAPNGRVVSHWDRVLMVIDEATSSSLSTPKALSQLIRSLQPDEAAGRALLLDTLEVTLSSYMPTHLVEVFFSKTIRWMLRVLVDAPTLFRDVKVRSVVATNAQLNGALVNEVIESSDIPILSQGSEGSVKMTQRHAATLLVCGFFSLMPHRYHPAGMRYKKGDLKSPYTSPSAEYGGNLPAFNFNGLFGARYHEHERRPQAPLYGKIACLLNYFITMSETWETVVGDKLWIEVVRCVKSQGEVKTSFVSGETNAVSPLTADTELLIEDCVGQLQADFANQMLGGGVLGKGCVQEEIRMVVSPELLVGLLMCESMRSREAVIMNGCAQYSSYVGYARAFGFSGTMKVPAPTPLERDVLRMRNISVVAFDAINFHSGGMRPSDQFDPKFIDAEIIKAFVAFSGSRLCTISSSLDQNLGGSSTTPALSPQSGVPPIATGHWGCGAFGGDRELKFLIQLCAASFAGRRHLTYCTFGEDVFTKRCVAVHKHLAANSVTAGKLYRVLIGYKEQRALYNVSSIFDYLLC